MITKKDPSIIQSYLEDSSNLRGGSADEVRIPETYDEVSSILRYANQHKIPVTISGGGTGTSGGRIPFGGIVLSTERLNRILSVKKEDSKGFITCQAGVTIKDLKSYADSHSLFYTYDPTEQTAFIGGTVATNASGARSFKYGSTRQTVFALTVTLADGSIFNIERGKIKAKNYKLKFTINDKNYIVNIPTYIMPDTKSSAGYFAKKDMDLVDLFIGQEGTLACVLQVTLKLNKKPDDILSSFVFFDNEESAYNFAIKGRALSRDADKKGILIDALSLEYFDHNTLELLNRKYGNIPRSAKACIFFEQEISKNKEDDIIKSWEHLISKYGSSLDNTWVAMNDYERQDMLDKRHWLGEAMNEMTKLNKYPKVSTDLAVPYENFSKMITYYKDTLKEIKIQYYLFGHIGDCHLHLTLMPKSEKEFKDAKDAALKFVKKSASLGGTVSAEHGIGKMRKEYLEILYGKKGINEMRKVKEALDPNFILGRDNIFSSANVTGQVSS